MPVSGDTLRYSFAPLPDSLISPADSGANRTWNYALSPTRQAVDTYKLAATVNLTYAFTVGLTAVGYKVADSFPIPGGLLPVSIQQVYTFFENKTSPSRFQAQAFAAVISGLPTPINYTNPDVWYFFPLAYGNEDSANYKLNIALPGLGGIKQVGNRRSRVDGWGTITTPYYTTPVNCIRVRSVIHEIDSLSISAFPSIGFPRNSVEYKWMVNGDHYPALWVTSNVGFGGTGETITSIRYRDVYRDTTRVSGVAEVAPAVMEIKVVPNPVTNGIVSLEIPDSWKNFEVGLYDIHSRRVATFSNEKLINISELPAGTYVGIVISGKQTGYVKITKE